MESAFHALKQYLEVLETVVEPQPAGTDQRRRRI